MGFIGRCIGRRGISSSEDETSDVDRMTERAGGMYLTGTSSSVVSPSSSAGNVSCVLENNKDYPQS